MSWLEEIDDSLLLESFYKAKEINLSKEFIQMLYQELTRREIEVEDSY